MSKVTTDQIGELIAQGKSGRVTRELLRAFLRNPQGHVNDKLEDYHVTVDYGMSLDDMIAAGRYDWKNGDINGTNFDIKGEGTVETNLELVHLNKVASTDEVEEELEKQGMRPATLEELLAFGAAYPEVQREFPIISLGSSWLNPLGARDVPCLDRHGSERALDLYWRGRGWAAVCRFLAVRK